MKNLDNFKKFNEKVIKRWVNKDGNMVEDDINNSIQNNNIVTHGTPKKDISKDIDADRNLKVNNFTDATNRSRGQTEMLLGLLDGDWDKVRELEKRIRGHHLGYCPGSKEECEKILAMPEPKSDYLHEWNVKLDPKNKWALVFTGPDGKKHYVAVPSTTGDRVDIIEADYIGNRDTKNQWAYHYDCKPDKYGNYEFKGMQIHIENGKIVLPISN